MRRHRLDLGRVTVRLVVVMAAAAAALVVLGPVSGAFAVSSGSSGSSGVSGESGLTGASDLFGVSGLSGTQSTGVSGVGGSSGASGASGSAGSSGVSAPSGVTPAQSRTAYSGLGASDAVSLAKQVFHVDDTSGEVLPIPAGASLKSYVGSNLEQLHAADGSHLLAYSAVPWRVNDGGGLKPVSLAMTSAGSQGGFTTANGPVNALTRSGSCARRRARARTTSCSASRPAQRCK